MKWSVVRGEEFFCKSLSCFKARTECILIVVHWMKAEGIKCYVLNQGNVYCSLFGSF